MNRRPLIKIRTKSINRERNSPKFVDQFQKKLLDSESLFFSSFELCSLFHFQIIVVLVELFYKLIAPHQSGTVSLDSCFMFDVKQPDR